MDHPLALSSYLQTYTMSNHKYGHISYVLLYSIILCYIFIVESISNKLRKKNMELYNKLINLEETVKTLQRQSMQQKEELDDISSELTVFVESISNKIKKKDMELYTKMIEIEDLLQTFQT